MRRTRSCASFILALVIICATLVSGLQARAVQVSVGPTNQASCPGSDVLNATESAFGTAIVRTIGQQAFYLNEAAENGQVGTATLCLHVQRDGTIDHVLIDRSSGYPLLDGAALYAVGLVAAVNEGRMRPPRSLSSAHSPFYPGILPPPPPELLKGQDALWLRFPFSFSPADDPNNRQVVSSRRRPQALDPLVDEMACAFRPKPAVDTAQDVVDTGRDPVAPAEVQGSFSGLVRKLSGIIGGQFFYPAAAVQAGIDGTVHLSILMARDGAVICAKVRNSSGDAILDGSALIAVGQAAVKKAFPAFPIGVQPESQVFDFEVPITYEIR